MGAIEIVSIWRDAPGRTLVTRAAFGYIALNAGASAVALALTQLFGWKFGFTEPDAVRVQWIQLLAAGFGAMTLLRSSLLTFRAGDEPVAVGPGKVLLTALTSVGRAVDRTRAEDRSARVAALMADVSFQKALAVLPAYCLGLMQNLSDEDQAALAKQTAALDRVTNERVKSLLLGLALMNVVGVGVLEASVKTLNGEIKVDPTDRAPVAPDPRPSAPSPGPTQ